MSDWLNEIEVASPCHEDWAAMRGDERARHCASCRQDVYDLSGMSRDEALALVRRAQGGEEVCVRFRRRADGTVLTADCPSQVRRARVTRKGLRGVAASAAALIGGGLAQGCEPNQPSPPPNYSYNAPFIVLEEEVEVTPDAVDPAVGGEAACCEDGRGACCAPGESRPSSEPGEPVLADPISEDKRPVPPCEDEVMMGKMMVSPPTEAELAEERLLEALAEPAPAEPAPALEGPRRLPRAGE